MLVAGGFCYGRLLDESCIARESQNSPAPARASDRLLNIWPLAKHDIVLFSLGVPPPGRLDGGLNASDRRSPKR